MSTRVDIEEIETTKSEKLLAVVLTVFLLIGGLWAYEKVDDVVRDDPPVPASEAAYERQELWIFLPRLAFVLASMVFAFWLLSRLRTRASRYLPIGFAFVAFATLMALVMTADYVTDYIDPLDLGPLVLSLVGIALSLVAFYALQRYLAKRIPYRRVRKRECPFCGYPVHDNEHCEGCGREVMATCATCGGARRVGTVHCATCGSA